MYRIEQVLVPVDFSSFSRCALAFGRKLGETAETEGGGLQLAHAVETLPPYIRSVLFPYAPLGEDDREFEAEMAAAVREHMQKYFEFDAELRERFIEEPVVEFGSSKALIRQWVGRFDIDMVAAGAFGRHGVFAGGPGSTARRLVEVSPCPVALIRDYEPEPTVDRIMAAVDLGTGSQEVVETAMALAIEHEAVVEVLCAVPTPSGRDSDWMVDRHIDIDLEAVEQKTKPRVEKQLRRLIDGISVPFAQREDVERLVEKITVVFGDPATEIGRRAEESDVDVVIVGRGGRPDRDGRGKRRVVSAVMAEVPKHLVVVPATRERTPLSD